MTAVAAPPMTADEFFAFVHRPENRDRIFELERGEVIEMSRPGIRHGCVCGNVSRILGNYAFAVGRGFVCANDTGLVVAEAPDTVRGPDVLYFAEAPRFDELETRFGRTPPVLAVEVLSPTDRLGRVNQRIHDQLRFGVAMVWLVDPESATVTVYRRGREFAVLGAGEAVADDDLLPGFRCNVSDFFATPGH